MRALTLHRPWPWAIFFAGKCVENRTWFARDVIGERIAIHAGKVWDDYSEEQIFGPLATPNEARHEGIIGTALVVGIVTDGWLVIAGGWGSLLLTQAAPWFVGRYGWLLDERRALPEPIPCRGMQGLWTVPDAVAAMVAAAEVKGG